MDILVGYTGFVGSNILKARCFDRLFNSTNIEQAFGLAPDLCVYSGVRAEKFLANAAPEKDLEAIRGAEENIEKIKPKKMVLISTADVYADPREVDENTVIDSDTLQPYGKNRFYLEEWVRGNVPDYHIIRLPGLFGENLKKNFLYDLIHVLPSMLTASKYEELARREALIAQCYHNRGDGFYRCEYRDKNERELLKQAFERAGFSALHFTDSRAKFQFFNLAYLWEHIELAAANGIRLLNLAVEPVGAAEIYRAVTGKTFYNEMEKPVPSYNIKTIYDKLFGGQNGYIFDKEQSTREIFAFVRAQQQLQGE